MGKFIQATTVTIAGQTIVATIQQEAETPVDNHITLPAGSAGTLTTRDGDDEGDVTLSAGHGLAQDDIVDVYWSGGLRYSMKVTDVDDNVVSIGGVTGPGAGDVLPAQDTAIVCTKQVDCVVVFPYSQVKAVVVAGNLVRAHVDFQDSDEDSIKQVEVPAQEYWSWNDDGTANPFGTSTVAHIKASNGQSDVAGSIHAAYLLDTVS